MAEVTGELELERPGGRFTLRARADRIEQHPDGSVTVVDYKTGRPAARSAPRCAAGLAPQLPLEGLMAEAGAFDGQAPAAVAALLFWHLKGDESGGVEQAREQAGAAGAGRGGA